MIEKKLKILHTESFKRFIVIEHTGRMIRRTLFFSYALCLCLMCGLCSGYGHATQKNSDCTPSCAQTISPSTCPSSNYDCNRPCWNFYVRSDFLYWRAYEEGLQTCCFPGDILDEQLTDGMLITHSKGKSKDPDFLWNAGFRLGTGVDLPTDQWNIELLWTHFNSRAHGRQKNGKLNWKIDLNIIDLLAKYSCCWCGVQFTPFAGLRSALIKQNAHSFITILTSGFYTDGANDFSFYKSGERNKQCFWGIGPVFGLEADWNWKCGWGLYGNTDVNVMYGNFHVSKKIKDIYPDKQFFDSKSRQLNACTFMWDVGLGIKWCYLFCNQVKTVLKIGWEHHRLFNQNQIYKDGDLCLDGGTFSLQIEF